MRALAKRIAGALAAAALAAGVALTATRGTAQIERFGDLQPPDLLELNGHVGKPFAAETGGWELKLGVGYSRTVYDFHLATMRVLNSGRLPQTILFAVEPSRPNFTLFAPDAELAKLAAAAPNDTVRIIGYRGLGSTVLMVTSIELSPPPTAMPQVTPGT